jgi:hypothetical protein
MINLLYHLYKTVYNDFCYQQSYFYTRMHKL